MRHNTSARRWVLRALVTAVVVPIAAMAISVSPAAADGPHSWADGSAASVWFKSNGDHFYVCDHARDGHSAVAEYYYELPGGGTSRLVTLWNHTGVDRYNGCVDFGRGPDIPENRRVVYRACVGEYGPRDVWTSTCGPRRAAWS